MENTEDISELQFINSNNQFARKLFRAIAEDVDENVFMSSISVYTLLAMIYQGAVGTTREALTDAMTVPNQTAVARGYNHVSKVFESLKEATIYKAEKIFMTHRYSPKSDFLKVIRRSFLTEVEILDFALRENTAKNINEWVQKMTQSKVNRVIEPRLLSAFDNLVLVNAIYMKTSWSLTISKWFVRREPFNLVTPHQVYCPMMHISEPLDYYDHQEWNSRIVRLPLSNENTSFILILPKSSDGIIHLESKLMDADFTILTNSLKNTLVHVALPKFRIQSTINLHQILKEMNLGRVFNSSNDFSGIFDTPERLRVNAFIQKAFIEVDEHNSPTPFKAEHDPEQIKRVYANRPFIFLIEASCNNCSVILFCGKLMDPTA